MQRHPFSPGTSGRDPFPPFAAAMAAAAPDSSDDDGDGRRSALDWSIDSLAELKPVPMTPSDAQKAAAAVPPTPLAADAPRRFPALLTPSPLTSAGRPPVASQRGASPEYARELHARCRAAVERYQRGLRERQRRMDQLAVRADKRGASPSPSSWALERSPPAKRTRSRGSSDGASVPVSPGSASSARMRSPGWWPSPIARTALFTSPGFVRTPSPSLAGLSPGSMAKGPFTPADKPSFVCELSPIAAGDEETAASQGDATKAMQETAASTSSRDADSSLEPQSSVKAEARGSDDDNGRDQGGDGGETPGKENHTPSQGENSQPADKKGSSVSRRQEQFAAAMEEAKAPRRQSNANRYRVLSSASGCSAGRAASILTLYAEAKAMGLSSPHAQWEYVRLLQSPSSAPPSSQSSRSSRSLSFDRSPSSTAIDRRR